MRDVLVSRRLAVNVIACVLLPVQYLLGMVTNLYVVLPARHPGARAALTWRSGGRAGRVLAVLGALTIIGAGFNGASFLNYNDAVSSLIMAALWALALACYLAGAVLAVRRPVHGS